MIMEDKYLLVVVKIAVVDDGRVQDLGVGLYDVVCLLGNHTSRTPIFRVNYKQHACSSKERSIHTKHYKPYHSCRDL